MVRYKIFNKASFAIGNLAYSSLCTYQFFSVTTFGVMKNVSDPIRRLSSIVIAIVMLLNAGDDSASCGIIWSIRVGCNCKKIITLKNHIVSDKYIRRANYFNLAEKMAMRKKTNKQKFREKGSLTVAILEELVFPDATAYTKECFLRNFVFI